MQETNEELGYELIKLLAGKSEISAVEEAAALKLIENGADLSVSINKQTALMKACMLNSFPLVKSLVEHGADIKYRYYVETHSSFSLGHYNSVEKYANASQYSNIRYYILAKLNPPKRDWLEYDAHSVADVNENPSFKMRLTHIFNFDTREKMTIAENLETKAMTMSPVESFDTVDQPRLQEAFNQYKVYHPDADESVIHSAVKPFSMTSGGAK